MKKKNDMLDHKHETLQGILKNLERVIVAFSGGVDSTLLLKVAHQVLGEQVLAVTAVSEITSRQEQADSVRIAEMIGAKHLLVETDDLNDPDFTTNPADKCYYCKKRRFRQLQELAASKGYHAVVDGSNTDDQHDYRPGHKAVKELGIRSPLSEAGLDKHEIRLLSEQLGLPTWDKPSAACLASRIPYNQTITAEKLRQIDTGEAFLRQLFPMAQIRVRHHGNLARLEISPQEIAHLVADDIRRQVVDHFKGLGFQFVTLDMEGYSMGSLNREL